jgi:hypothetical protein
VKHVDKDPPAITTTSEGVKESTKEQSHDEDDWFKEFVNFDDKNDNPKSPENLVNKDGWFKDLISFGDTFNETDKPETEKPETEKPETEKPETEKPETEGQETWKSEINEVKEPTQHMRKHHLAEHQKRRDQKLVQPSNNTGKHNIPTPAS